MVEMKKEEKGVRGGGGGGGGSSLFEGGHYLRKYGIAFLIASVDEQNQVRIEQNNSLF